MSTDDFGSIAATQAWVPETQVIVLLRYIANQDSDDAFLDFLHQQQDEENAVGTTPAPIADEDWTDDRDSDGKPCRYENH